MSDEVPVQAVQSGKGGCLRGCLIGFILFVILVLLLCAAGGWFAWKEYETVMQRFERAGYTNVIGQFIVVDKPVEQPTIFIGQTVKINSGSRRGIAFLCQSAEIHGEVVGNVHFKGMDLTVHEDAWLQQDLDMFGLNLNLFGSIKGKITGRYQALHRKQDSQP